MKNQIENVVVSTQTEGDVIPSISELEQQVREGLEAQENGCLKVAMALAMICDVEYHGKKAQMIQYAEKTFGIRRTNFYNYLKVVSNFCRKGKAEYQLTERWQRFGYSQLQAILELPVADWEKVTPEMSVREISRLKQEKVRKIRKASKVTETSEILASYDSGNCAQIDEALLQRLKTFFEAHPNGKISIVAIEAPELPQKEQKSLSEAEEPQEGESPLEAVKSQEAPSEAVEPQEAPSEAEEPQESPTEIMEPQETPSEAEEPQESPTEVMEPQESPSGTVEPQENPSEAVEPQKALSKAVEPQEAPSETVEYPNEEK